MKTFISPSSVNGKVCAPASKSYMQRAIIASMLADGHSMLNNCSLCNDTNAVIEIARVLGAKIEQHNSQILIDGGFRVPSSELNCNESGLALRMISPIAALLNDKVIINGGGSLLSRPLDMITDALAKLNINFTITGERLPLTIFGNLQGGDIEIDGSKSSQLLSGLLMALPLAKNNSTIVVNQLKSKPYIDMTIELLNQFGIEITHSQYHHFFISGNQKYRSVNYTIEGDWSSASFLLVAGAVGGQTEMTGLNPTSKQADSRLLGVLSAVGANVIVSENMITVKKNRLAGFEFDAVDSPDLFPPLVTLATQCNSPSIIHGVSRLFSKESNRAMTLMQEFDKIGVEIKLSSNSMIVNPSKIKFNVANSHNDHRIAMALAVAALSSEEGIEIEDFECINKSYPQFLNDLNTITQNIVK
jgi:3-phosphoshikimate 1-carboxyvinyltransferase